MEEHPKLSRVRLNPQADLKSLPLGPREGFLLSRLEGTPTLEEVADLTSMSVHEAHEMVEQLVALDVLEWLPQEAPRSPSYRPSAPPSNPPSTPPSRLSSPGTSGRVRTRPPPPGTSRVLYDPSELEEDVDLEMERRRKVLDTFYRLDELTHYELLGLELDASKQDVRKSYFELSKVFHPDTAFRKRLGSYKPKMEIIFRRLTEAYEVLSRKKTREEYDAYNALRARTKLAQARLDEVDRDAEELAREALRGNETIVFAPSSRPPSEPLTTRSQAQVGVLTPSPEWPNSGDGERTSERPGEDTRKEPSSTPPRHTSEIARQRARELIARKLAAATGRPVPGRSSLPPSAPASPHPAPTPPPIGRQAVLRGLTSSLKQTEKVTGGITPADRHVADARKAESQGDLVSAANALRLAIAIAPDRADVRAEYERVRQAVAASLADTYEQQAQYEERNQKWAAAALSWSRVADGRPEDANAARNAANALVQAQGDLHLARRLAQRAVTLRPEDARNRAVLAQVFIAAGMPLNAKRELDSAVKLDPNDEIVNNLLRELRQ